MNKIFLFIFLFFVCFFSNVSSQWISCNKDFENLGLSEIWVGTSAVIDGTLFAGLRLDGIFSTKNNGTDWYSKNYGINNIYITSFIQKEKNIFVSTENKVYITTNFGNTWIARTSGLNSDIQTFCLTVHDNFLFLGTGEGLYKSVNDGLNWFLLNNSFENVPVFSLFVNNNKLFAGTDQGLFLSEDNGDNWKSINPSKYGSVLSFAVKDSCLYVGMTNNEVYVSKDNGTSWSVFKKGNPNGFNIMSLIATEKILFSASQSGIYAAIEDNDEWIDLKLGKISDASTLSIIGDTIFAGFKGDGIYKANVNDFNLNVPAIPSAPTNLKYSIIGDSIRFSWNYSNMDLSFCLFEDNSAKGSFSTLVASQIMGNEYKMLIPTSSKTVFYAIKAYDSTKKLYSNISNILSLIVTGIDDSSIISKVPINLYPQPVNDQFIIYIEKDLIGPYYISVFNMMGYEILPETIANENEIIINSSLFASGIYYFSIKSGNKIFIKKFVKI